MTEEPELFYGMLGIDGLIDVSGGTM